MIQMCMRVCIYERVGETDLSNNTTYCRSCPGGVFVCVQASYLVAIHHEVVGGDKGFEDHHPAGVSRALKQRIRQLGNVHVHLIGAVDQIWQDYKKKKTHKELHDRRKQRAVMRKAFKGLITLENSSKLLFTRRNADTQINQRTE